MQPIGSIGINPRAIQQYIALFFVVAFCGALWFEQNSLVWTIFIWILFGWKYITGKRLFYNEALIMSGLLLLIFAFVRLLTSGGIGITDWLLITSQILVVYIAVSYNPDRVLQRFINLCAVICVISLCYYGIQLIDPHFLELILYPTFFYDQTYYGTWFYVYRPYNLLVEANRNNSIFTEPGRFQTIISAALFIIFFLKERVNFSTGKYIGTIILFVVTMISTGSTTGIINLSILAFFYYIQKDRRQKSARKKVSLIIVIAITFLAWDYESNPEKSILNMYVIQKVIVTDSLDQGSSGGARLRMLYIIGDAIKNHPLGAGQQYITDRITVSNTAGAGLFRFIAAIGVLPSIFLLSWILRPFYVSKQWMNMCSFILIYINTGAAQTYALYTPYMLVSVFLCCMNRSNRLNKE